MLFDILNYIKREKFVSEQQLSRHFQTNSEVLNSILERLSKKNLIHQVPLKSNCMSACSTCFEKQIRYFALDHVHSS
ncbi:MAG: hypothetical protein A3F18_03520 [Legionellales bacterium RIFCSPHIGHO2_12_FULL_37_14]|nr:MAG: hypothetical protein A3F18_03520 [Legionellales bacterium RIFCSPHIGHO2_12_FULL_37_14]